MNEQAPLGHVSQTTTPMVLILGTADWNQAIATNQHYMARELATEFPVLFSESLGLRRPELSKRDIARMARRLGRGTSSQTYQREVPNGLDVVKPIIVPLHVPATRQLNRLLLRRTFQAWHTHRGPRILWTYSPITYGYEELADIVVYHCVDLLGEFPQIDSTIVDRGERKLAAHSTLAIGSSEAVCEHLSSRKFGRVEHWPNVADVSLIRKAGEDSQPRTAGRVVFAGNFSEKKIDFDLLFRLTNEDIELHLAGPIAEGGGKANEIVRELVRNGAVYHGHLPLLELAKLYWTSTVGIIPYALNPYTLGVNPLKTYEYLAAGLKVVSTAVPAVTAYAGHVHVAKDGHEFVQEVIRGSGVPSQDVIDSRQHAADRNSWTLRGVRARQELTEILNNRVKLA